MRPRVVGTQQLLAIVGVKQEKPAEGYNCTQEEKVARAAAKAATAAISKFCGSNNPVRGQRNHFLQTYISYLEVIPLVDYVFYFKAFE